MPLAGKIRPAEVGRAKSLWAAALAYLDEHAGIKSVRAHMADPPASKRDSLPAIFEGLLSSLRNRQAMKNTIGDLERLRPMLCQFDPHAVAAKYGNDWRKLLHKIIARLNLQVNPDNARGYWVHFAKGAIDGAQYLKKFADATAFVTFVKDFYAKPTTRPALPLLLSAEIHGFGFPLACDFLKEIGFTQYVKPDVHVIDLFHRLGLSSKTELDVYRAVCQFAEDVGETPFAVDKAFWLIGSGNLYLEDRRFRTSRDRFLATVSPDAVK